MPPEFPLLPAASNSDGGGRSPRQRRGRDRRSRYSQSGNAPSSPDTAGDTAASADTDNENNAEQQENGNRNKGGKNQREKKPWEADVGKQERDPVLFTSESEEIEKKATLESHREKQRKESGQKREKFMAEVAEYEIMANGWQNEIAKEEKNGVEADEERIARLKRRIEKVNLFVQLRDVHVEIEGVSALLMERERERISIANELAALSKDQDTESSSHAQKKKALDEQRAFETELAAQVAADPTNTEKAQELEQLRQNIIANQTELDVLEQRVGAHPQNVQTLEDQWNALGRETAELERRLQELRDQGVVLRTQIRMNVTDLNEDMHEIHVEPIHLNTEPTTFAGKAKAELAKDLKATGRYIAKDANQASRILGGMGGFSWRALKDFGAQFMLYLNGDVDKWFHNPFKRAKSNEKKKTEAKSGGAYTDSTRAKKAVLEDEKKQAEAKRNELHSTKAQAERVVPRVEEVLNEGEATISSEADRSEVEEKLSALRSAISSNQTEAIKRAIADLNRVAQRLGIGNRLLNG
ncbi:MAG: hypothetical protein WC477_04555 [Patescibacteria group bacterium]